MKTCRFRSRVAVTPSTANRIVNARNGTHSPGIGVTASDVRRIPFTTQGCRPTSVTIQPASTATSPSGPTNPSHRRKRRPVGSALRRHPRNPATTAVPASVMPAPTITWKARWVTSTGGRSSSGKSSSPFTSASKSP